MKDIELITVEVAYALPHRQQLLALKVAPGTTAYEAVRQSGIVQQFPEIDLENVKMGIFGQALGTKGLNPPKTYVLEAGDSIFLNIANTNQLYCRSKQGNQKVNIIGT